MGGERNNKKTLRVCAGQAQGKAQLISPGQPGQRWSLSASLPTLPGVFVCVSSPEHTDARFGQRRGGGCGGE